MIRDFLQGYTNYIAHHLSLLSEEKTQMAHSRMEICKQCPQLRPRPTKDPNRPSQTLECGACHCNWPALTFAPNKPCPLKKYPKDNPNS